MYQYQIYVKIDGSDKLRFLEPIFRDQAKAIAEAGHIATHCPDNEVGVQITVHFNLDLEVLLSEKEGESLN